MYLSKIVVFPGKQQIYLKRKQVGTFRCCSPKAQVQSLKEPHTVHGVHHSVNLMLSLLLPLSSYFPVKIYGSSSLCSFFIAPESIRIYNFSNVFRGYRKGTLVSNGGVLYKKAVLKNFAIFTGKHLY